MAKVISRLAVAVVTAAAQGHGGFRYGGLSLWRPFAIADPNRRQKPWKNLMLHLSHKD